MNDRNIDKMIDAVSKQSGANKEALKKAAKSGEVGDLLNNLKPDEVKRIKDLMNNKSALEKLLNSEKAQQLLKNLTEGK